MPAKAKCDIRTDTQIIRIYHDFVRGQANPSVKDLQSMVRLAESRTTNL